MKKCDSAVKRFSPGSSLVTKELNLKKIVVNRSATDSPLKPLLSVGIPVFNGADHVCRTLESLKVAMCQLEDKDEVEIIFCDNASTDETEDIILNFMRSAGLSYAYYQHSVNVGMDLNLDALMSLGVGEYVWILGCGDIIKDDSFQRLLQKIQGLRVANILLDFNRFSEQYGEVVSECEHQYKHDILFDYERCSFPCYSPAISANIVNRSLWLECLDKGFVVGGWGHVERILQMLSLGKNKGTAIFMDPFFTLFMEKDGWWMKQDSFKLHLSHIKAIKNCSSAASIGRLKSLNGIVLLRSVLHSKRLGYSFTKSDMKEIRGSCNWETYAVFSVLKVLPNFILPFFIAENWWASIKRKVKRK